MNVYIVTYKIPGELIGELTQLVLALTEEQARVLAKKTEKGYYFDILSVRKLDLSNRTPRVEAEFSFFRPSAY